ncbi:helix-turn-helix domain-containing protein [Trichodesmium erythraeum 21-75]|nr:helix-turn-helix domain-containing protein [Trichodesmium erythraeum 21-75]
MYYKFQKEYLRKRLLAIKYLYEGKTRTEVSDLLDCHYQTLSTWIDKFLEGGLKNLIQLITHQVSSRLNIKQNQIETGIKKNDTGRIAQRLCGR